MFKKSILALTSIALLASCEKDEVSAPVTGESGKFQVNFDNMVGTEDLQLQKNYRIDGKNYTFENFRYWVSNIRLQKEDGSWHSVTNSYYLIEETGAIAIQEGQYNYAARKRENISLPNIPQGTYKAIEFGIGVDKEKNDNLSITGGELSIMNGMTNTAWMWHTSYIFSSLKGMVENNTTKVLKLETGLNDSYRTVRLNLASTITFELGKNAVISLRGDILTLLASFDNWEKPTVGAQQVKEMKNISDNFKNIFFTIK
ncbi:hypothetical protein FLAT13_01084 [Flavobacterium salmonis]|uniref:Copper-binding protein MbnP-like domain-containing protein n=2 Tax=Flavobacterium salmonis TaxID=2654844 RepID=A0A6V6YSA2_9FLAO|nr:hypothetical protein FLAT13_01084 [Flavobacterium salmonis]